MPQPHILSVLNEGVLTLTIERPEALNALNSQIIEELSEALDLAQTNEKVQVMILTGSGSKAFVAGADIKEFADFSAKQGKELANIFDSLRNSEVDNLSSKRENKKHF